MPGTNVVKISRMRFRLRLRQLGYCSDGQRVEKRGNMKKHILCLLLCLTVSGCSTLPEGPVNEILKEKEGTMKSRIVLETTQGNIEIELMPETAPKACENFTALAEKGYYNGIIFHRVIKGFMIQGGDPTGTGRGGASKWGAPFEDEVVRSVTFDRAGILAMANAGPNTNGSQFFITTAPAPWLNMKHTIFGEVVEGGDVVKKLETVPVGSGDRPIEDQRIIKAYVVK